MNPLALLGSIPSLYLWVALGWLLSLGVACGYGMHLVHAQLEAYQTAVKAVGDAQESWVKAVAKLRTQISQEVVHALQTRNAALSRDNAVVLTSLRAHAGRSVLPPAAPPTGGDQAGGDCRVPPHLACFDRDFLDAGIRAARERALDGHRGGLSRGDRGLSALQACIDLVERNETVTDR